MNVKVILNGNITEIPEGTKLSEISHMDRPCGGHGTCGKCKVIARGSLSPVTETEQEKLSKYELEMGFRLACMTYITGDCEIETSISNSKAKIITDGIVPEFELSPIFRKYGLAIDIGTTTIAAKLYGKDGNLLNEESRLNPQSKFGADVISRIEASMKGEKTALSNIIAEELNKIIISLAETTEIQTDEIDAVVITGNTVMLHLLTGTDVTPLSKAPFNATRLFGESIPAKELNLSALFPSTDVFIPDCISAFVGADMVCAIISSEMLDENSTRILVDIGTNGEMALVNNGKLSVCSTAAGPAFEGAGISMGMGGRTGAVDKVEVIDGKIKANVIGNTAPVGICGSGMVDSVKCLLETAALDESGYLENGFATIVPPVILTQEDIRKIQLAKSAVYAGIKTMLKTERLEISDISRLFIAGGFGSFLDVGNAEKIGLIPHGLAENATVLGNAALSGASMILLNGSFMKKAKEIASKAKVLNLSSNKIFTEEFMEGMYFPI